MDNHSCTGTIAIEMRASFAAFLLLAAACDSTTPPVDDVPTPDTLAPPVQGSQLRAGGVLIPAGTEVEYCEVVTVPGAPTDVVWVKRIEAAMVAGSHHLIVSAVEPGSPTDLRITDGQREECALGAQQLGEDVEGLFGSQSRYWDEPLPAGVGRKLRGGQKLILDYHYANASESDLTAKVAINLHTAAEGEITHVVNTGGFMNFTIDVAPRQRASFFGECRLGEDVELFKLVRHTHKWGRRFAVWFAGGPRDGELAFESGHYEETDRLFDQPIRVKRGEGFRFECEYLNTESHRLVFGNTTKDEMCILFFTYWSPDPAREAGQQGCGLTTIDDDGVARD
jgi:hypothetical protein